MTVPEQLVELWDRQQAALVNRREHRFAIMLDVLEHVVRQAPDITDGGSGLTVLDLGCGPGSLSGRVLDRFPAANVIGVDYDPALLHLARTWLADRHPGRFTAVDADLAGREWREATDTVTAALSSTALHWLHPAQLVGLYADLAEVLRPGDVFMNADHLRYNPTHQPFLTELAAADDLATRRSGTADGALTWDEWWDRAGAWTEFASRLSERQQRFAGRPPTPNAPLELHVQGLLTAGFSEAGEIWRYLDDVVVLARR